MKRYFSFSSQEVLEILAEYLIKLNILASDTPDCWCDIFTFDDSNGYMNLDTNIVLEVSDDK